MSKKYSVFRVKALSALCVAACLLTETSSGQTEPTIVRIEQDWKLEIYTADGYLEHSPQVISSFQLPDHDILFQITWNHRDIPEYAPGGYQVQAWREGVLLGTSTSPRIPLIGENPTVSWTQVAATLGEDPSSAEYSLRLKNEVASCWGELDDDVASCGAQLTGLGSVPDLSTYSWLTIADNSTIVKGTNRVKWFGVVETRFYDQAGSLVSRDTVTKTLFSQPSSFTYFQYKRLDGSVDEQLLQKVDSDLAVMPVLAY